jgi:magnesium-transporting ATPase (P-type)
MEFKGGKLHQMISDQVRNSNKIYANRYQGGFGVWYFIIDTTFHFENILAVILFFLILYSQEYNQIQISFPIVALSVNFGLMCMRNLTLEHRQRKVTNKINNTPIEYLMITRRVKRFLPITWADAKPGYILRIKSGQEFPADCLILDIQGAAGQKCFVTSGPFDDSTGIIQKKSYAGTSNKTGSKQNE